MAEFFPRESTRLLDPASAPPNGQTGSPAKTQPESFTKPAQGQRLVDAIMAKIHNVDLDDLSREEAIELGSQIMAMLRSMGYADLSRDDYRTLSELMRKLTGGR